MISIRGYSGMQVGREERRRSLEAALVAMRDGALRVRIDDVLPLDQVNEAFERLVRREVQGKLLLGLWS
jgi:NADPH:quinone reductase-like Zn-dependent oxidoreductase